MGVPTDSLSVPSLGLNLPGQQSASKELIAVTSPKASKQLTPILSAAWLDTGVDQLSYKAKC